MAEMTTEREGLSPVAGELPQGAEDAQPPTTPVYRRGYGFDDDHDHDHHEKRSVLAKVKDKAKRWKNMLGKKRYANEGDSPTSWSSALDEEEEDEERDPEYHGAPMYESEMAPRAYKETGRRHHTTAQSLNPSPVHHGSSPNQLATLLNDQEEPALYHVDAIRETSDHHITVPDASEAIAEHENPMKERGSNKANHPSSCRTHLLRANTMQVDANNSNDEFFDTNILEANPRYNTNNPAFSDSNLLTAKQTNSITGIDKANHPAFSDKHLLMASSKNRDFKEISSSNTSHHVLPGIHLSEAHVDHKNSTREYGSNKALPDAHFLTVKTKKEDPLKASSINDANHPAFSSSTHLLKANREHGIPINDSSSNKTDHSTFSNTHLLMANRKHEDPIKKSSSNTTNHPTFSGENMLKANNEGSINTRNSRSGNQPIFSSTPLPGLRAKHKQSIEENDSDKLYHSAFPENLFMAKPNHKDPSEDNDISKANHPASSYTHIIRTKKGETTRETGSNVVNDPSNTHFLQGKRNNGEPIEGSFSSKVNRPISLTSHLARTKHENSIKQRGSDKVNHPALPNVNHLMAKKNCKDRYKGSDSDKTLTEKVSEMLAPAYATVSDTSHMIALKILCPTDGDEIGALQAHDPVKELTETVSKMLTPACSMVSDASHKIASKIHGPTKSDEIGAKLALEPLTKSSSKTFTETMSETLTPACSMVSDASHKIDSKIHGPAARDEIGVKLALEPLTESGSHKTFTETVSEMLAPAYTVVSDASQKIASKIQGPSALDEIAGKMAHDPIVKKSSIHESQTDTVPEKLAPAYIKVTGASNKVASKMQHTVVGDGKEAKQKWDKGVSVKEYLMHKLSPGEEDRALSQVITESMSPRKTGSLAKGSGVVEKVKAAVSSLLGKEGHPKSTTAVPSMLVMKEEHTAGLILPVSTSPRAVEIEEIDVKRVQAYAN